MRPSCCAPVTTACLENSSHLVKLTLYTPRPFLFRVGIPHLNSHSLAFVSLGFSVLFHWETTSVQIGRIFFFFLFLLFSSHLSTFSSYISRPHLSFFLPPFSFFSLFSSFFSPVFLPFFSFILIYFSFPSSLFHPSFFHLLPYSLFSSITFFLSLFC